MRLAAVILALLLLVGCSVNMGIGFRKTPWPATPPQIVQTEKGLKAMVVGLTPGQIQAMTILLNILGLDTWVKLAPYALRENEQATLGVWYDGGIYR